VEGSADNSARGAQAALRTSQDANLSSLQGFAARSLTLIPTFRGLRLHTSNSDCSPANVNATSLVSSRNPGARDGARDDNVVEREVDEYVELRVTSPRDYSPNTLQSPSTRSDSTDSINQSLSDRNDLAEPSRTNGTNKGENEEENDHEFEYIYLEDWEGYSRNAGTSHDDLFFQTAFSSTERNA